MCFAPTIFASKVTVEAAVARRTIEVLTSDLSGEEMKPGQGATIEFSVRGTAYVIDLTDREAKAFHKAVEPYVQNGTKVGRISTRLRSGRSGSEDDLQAIREWARANGYKVADRGRISVEIKEAYRKAH